MNFLKIKVNISKLLENNAKFANLLKITVKTAKLQENNAITGNFLKIKVKIPKLCGTGPKFTKLLAI